MVDGKRITLQLGPKGIEKIEAHGFQGATCSIPMELVTSAAGANPADVETKDEFFNQQHDQEFLTN